MQHDRNCSCFFFFSIYVTPVVKYLAPIILNIFTYSSIQLYLFNLPLLKLSLLLTTQSYFSQPIYTLTTHNRPPPQPFYMTHACSDGCSVTLHYDAIVTVLQYYSLERVIFHQYIIIQTLYGVTNAFGGRTRFDFDVDEVMSFLRVYGQLPPS